MDKNTRYQISDIEEYLTNISKYIGGVTFTPVQIKSGEKNRFNLIHLGREKEYFDNFSHKIRTLIRNNPEYIKWNFRGLTLYDALSEINIYIGKID